MPYEVKKPQDWVVTGPDGQPVNGLLVTVLDEASGEHFNVEVPGKTAQLVQQYVQAAIAEREATLGMRFD